MGKSGMGRTQAQLEAEGWAGDTWKKLKKFFSPSDTNARTEAQEKQAGKTKKRTWGNQGDMLDQLDD